MTDEEKQEEVIKIIDRFDKSELFDVEYYFNENKYSITIFIGKKDKRIYWSTAPINEWEWVNRMVIRLNNYDNDIKQLKKLYNKLEKEIIIHKLSQ